MRKATMLALAIIIAATCFAGWERTYGGSEDDYAYSVAQTADGGYIVAGWTYSFGAGDVDVYLIKTTATGDTQWTRTYGGSDDEVIYSVAQTADGGYVLAGWTGPYDAHDVYIVKVSATGDLQWTKTYGGHRDDEANSVAQTPDGGYIVAGFSESFDDGAWGDVYLLKLDSSGDSVWTRTYGGSGYDWGESVAQTTDGGYIVAGETWSFGTGGKDVYLIKTDVLGDTIWTRTYGGRGLSVAQTIDGGYIVSGETESFGAGSADIYLVKTDADGDTIWTRTYGGSDYDGGYSVVQSTDGGYIVAGWTSSFGAGDDDFYLIKTDAEGDTIWTRTFGGSDYDWGYSVVQTSDGGYIVAGYTNSFGADYGDVYLIKTDSEGNVE